MRAVHDAVLVDLASVDVDQSCGETAKVVLTHDLRIPIHIALGRYEAATKDELEELITDLGHELARRDG